MGGGEPAHVEDRGFQGAADFRQEIRGRPRKVIASEHETRIGKAAAEPCVAASHGVGALTLNRVEDLSCSAPDRGVGNRSTPGQRDELGISRRRSSGRAKIQPI